MHKISFTTLGCKTNHHDTDVLIRVCRQAGYEVVGAGSKADAHVINTCTVTSAASAQARNLVRRLVRENPGSIVIVCGCSTQIDPGSFRSIGGVHYVLGVCPEDKLLSILARHFPQTADHGPAPSFVQDRARALLKIQDGCNNRCAYCQVSLARGPSSSVPVERIIKERDELLRAGFEEIVLTGIHIGQYGQDLKPQVSLTHLVATLVLGSKNFRVRLGSLNPEDVCEKMMQIFSHPQVCRHLHLSLQSGCDEVLALMERRPGVGQYASALRELARRVPGLAVGADIIVGFPGETEAYYRQTRDYLDSLPLAYLHVFPFSPRPGTKAVAMTGQVPERIRKERMRELKALSMEKRRQFYLSQLGKKLQVVIISKRKDRRRMIEGISDNYLPVWLIDSKAKYRDTIWCTVQEVLEGEQGVKAVEGHLA